MSRKQLERSFYLRRWGVAVVRDRELAAAVETLESPGTTTVVLGPVGIGRSWLVDRAGEAVSAAGHRVLRAAGCVDERAMPYAGLHQLLHADLEQVDAALPPRQRVALLGALGLDDPPADDPLLVATGALSALRLLAATRPVAVVVDDLHLLDPASAQVVAFLGRRVGSEAVSVLAAQVGGLRPAGFERANAVLDLAPLGLQDASEILDACAVLPTGRTRLAVLALADGNPLVLRELAREHAGEPFTERAVLSGPLRPTRTIAAAFPCDLSGLPAATRAAVVDLAVGDDEDLSAVDVGGDPDATAWAPLAAHGVIAQRDGRVRFRHPVLRSVVFHAVSPDERRAAHLRWVARLAAHPGRAVWHRAASSLGPDDVLADDLAAAANRWDADGDHDRAIAAWELAAELSGNTSDARIHLVAGLRAAAFSSHVPTARRLAAQALRHGPDPEVDAFATRAQAWLDAVSGRHDAALDTLLHLVEGDPLPREAALGPAATVAYHLGRPTARLRVSVLVDDTATHPGAAVPLFQASVNTWAGVATGRYHGDDGRQRVSAVVTRLGPRPLVEVGAAAWILDETATAITQLTARAEGAADPDGQALLVLGWSLLESGQWDAADRHLRRAVLVSRTWEQTTAEAAALVGLAHLAAVRGDREAAERGTSAGGRRLGPAASTAVDVRGHHSRGLAALGAGDHATAWTHLSHAATNGDRVRHFHASRYPVADLAESALRSGHREDVQRILARDGDPADPEVSARVRQLRHHAWAVVHADGGRREDAERHFHAALAERSGDTWPYERARVRLAHGRWLRRERRVAEARAPLELALVEFDRLGSAPWADLARQELRASGASRVPTDPQAAVRLTVTERQIVRHVAAGLTNREIGDLLFLSPRTVGSHLYRIFPKLGVTTRTQLRALEPPDG
ncbi:LuxR C-terminal-related transcriptional regulator [Jatrophihabitans sp. YIM 134969]